MNKLEKGLVALIVVVIAFSIFSINAHGMDNKKIHIVKNTEAEKEFVDNVKITLNDMGFENAGISLTKEVNEKGGLDYTISIHHRRIDKMDEYQRDELSDIIIGDGIKVNNCSVTTEYIEYMWGKGWNLK